MKNKVYIVGSNVETEAILEEAIPNDEVNKYEELRNKRVADNRKKMLQLFPSMGRPNEVDADDEGIPPQAKRQMCVMDGKCTSQAPRPTYERIYGKPPSGTSKDGLYGRAHLRKFFPHQWKLYNVNMSSFRS